MAQFLKPDNLNIVWASGGDRLYPGDTKYESGWGVEIPPRQYFNEIDYKQDQMLAHINQHGISVWDATTEYQAGKSYVQGSEGSVYRCLLTHVGQNPDTDITNTYWQVAFADKSSVVISSTLQAQQQTNDTVLLSPLKLFEAFGGSNQIKSPNGRQTLPGGIIVQWGFATPSTNVSNNTFYTFNYPEAFPTGVFCLVASNSSTSALKTYPTVATSLSNSQFQIAWSGPAGTATAAANWIAIGH